MARITATAALLVGLGMVIPAQPASAQVSISVTIGTFYDELSPYGQWIDCRYGECWVPHGVRAGWQPYSNGEWIYTRYGWTWVSSDPWGGDPYHYGTWTFVDRFGWVWVPGTVWAPAWVTWSYSDSYVGWAPMPPSITFGVSGYTGSPVVVGEAQYVFVPTDRFVGTNVASVRVEPRRNAEIFRLAKPVTRFEVSGGVITNMALPMATVQRATRSTIQTREISAAKTSPRTVSSGGVGKGGHVAIVAPAKDVKAAHASRQKAAPQAKSQQQAQPHQQKQEPKQQAEPQHQKQEPKQQAPPQKQEPQQQAQPQHQKQEPQHQQQAQPRQQAQPAGEVQGKDQKKEKKDPPGGNGQSW